MAKRCIANSRNTILKKIRKVFRRVAVLTQRKVNNFFNSAWLDKVDAKFVQIPMPGYRDIKFAEVLHYFAKGIGGGKVWQRAKGLSYSLLMALPPMLVFLFTLVAYLPINGVQDEILQQLEEIVPANLFQKISFTVNDVMGHKHSNLMSIGFITSVFLAANGIYGIYRSINNNPDVEHAKFLPVYGGSILMVFLLFILLVSAFSLMVGYKLLLSFMLANNFIAETTLSMFLFSFGRWIILILLTLFVINVIYRFVLVDRRQSKYLRFFSVGSVLSTILFFALTWCFQIYLNNFNRFNLLYGSIGTILVVMLWLFTNCYVLLLGYEVNISVIKSADDPNRWLSTRETLRQRRRARRSERMPTPQTTISATVPKQPPMADTAPTANNNEITLTLTFDNGRWKVKE